MKRIAWIALLFAMLLPAGSGADIEINGFVENQERVRIAEIEDAPEGEEYPLDLMMADTWLEFTVRGSGLDEKARMVANVGLKHFAMEQDEFVEMQLREAWAGYYHKYFSVEFGKKISIWGMADEMNPTDLICAEDLRWFFTYDKPSRKIGAYQAALAFAFGNFKLEGVWIPVFSPTILPESDQDWTPWKLQLFYNFVDLFPEYVDYQPDRFLDNKIANSSGALRFAGVAGPVDFELVAYDGWDHLPIFDVVIDPDPMRLLAGKKPLILREEYQRFNAFGGSLTGAIGPTTFRVEGAYYTDKYFMHAIDPALLDPGTMITAYNTLVDLQSSTFRSKKSSFNVVGGLDFRQGSWFYTNLQYFHMQILDYDDALLDEELENGIQGKVEFTMLDDTLKLAIDGAYNFSQEDWLAKPYVAYLLTDALEVQGGVSLFGGDYRTNFGEFDQNDYAFVKMRYTF